jgi:hypothetical protein
VQKKLQNRKSFFKGSFLTTKNCAIYDLIWLAYIYLYLMPISGIIATYKIHSEATTAWKKYIRQLLADI